MRYTNIRTYSEEIKVYPKHAYLDEGWRISRDNLGGPWKPYVFCD